MLSLSVTRRFAIWTVGGALLGALIGWLFDASPARVAVCALIGAVVGFMPARSAREFARWWKIRDSIKKATREAEMADLQVTPLHAATRMNDPDVIVSLVKRGDDPNAQNSNGWTPLHYAQHFGAEAAYEALVKCGADENIWNNDGETPKEWRWKKQGSGGYSRSYSTSDHEQARRRTPARW